MTTTGTELFAWRDAYSVRIPQIDEQHKRLIQLINELHAAMMAARGNEVLGGILDELVRYTETHFSYEEGLLARRQYRALAAHQAEHQRLKKQVYDLRDEFRSGRIAMTTSVMQFLKDWLSKHILSYDQEYARVMAG